MGKLQIRRGAPVPAQLRGGEPFFDGTQLYIGKLPGTGGNLAIGMTEVERAKLADLKSHDKGFFANEAAIIAALTVGQSGWFVRNGETDTIWTWDVDGEAWVDTGSVGGGSAIILIALTYAASIIAMNAGTLVPGATYKIIDRGDRGLFFTAITTSKFASTGTRLMLCPATYLAGMDLYSNNWIGVWNDQKTVIANDLAIWGGKVWRNLTGVIGTSIDDTLLDQTNWLEISKTSFANHEYIELLFGVMFDWDNDWICKQFDDKRNAFGLDYFTEHDENTGWLYGFNLADISDWNYSTSGKLFFNNTCLGVFNNSITDIYGNSNKGVISGNLNTSSIGYNINTGDIANNSNGGDIFSNSNGGDISSNLNAGNISWNKNSNAIKYNTNSGEISFNANNGAISGNTNSGRIIENLNNGHIVANSSGQSQCHISNNFFNGNINGIFSSDVTDLKTNKN